ncbi:hypothetical protein ACFVVM_22155 [Nocardia sp. NPDC058176]|uniref:hypothetical protein n=1 Tax=Nocardia sp. NPDC058176 TaxID=3346368 RepID=UPI0036DF1109
MGYPYGPQQGHDPYAGQGYAQPGNGPAPYDAPAYAAQPYAAPDHGAPAHAAPAYGAQPYAAPGYGTPAHAAPGYGTPDYGAPGYGASAHGALGYGVPAHAAPGYGASAHAVPAYGAPPHGYGTPGHGQPQVSGGTAIAAAVIGLVLSLLGGLSTAMTASAMEHLDGRMAGNAEVQLLMSGGFSAAMFLGSILLFCRKAGGRVLVIVASVLALVFNMVGIVLAVESRSRFDVEVNMAPIIATSVIGGGIAMLVLCLAAAKSTDRWIEAGRRSPYPYR